MKLSRADREAIQLLNLSYDGHLKNRKFFVEGGIYRSEVGGNIRFFVCMRVFPEPPIMKDADGRDCFCYAILRDDLGNLIHSHLIKRMSRVKDEET